ncbi:MAG: large subunit ribosomal protein L25 [Parcubacteria group bacterium LiPW_39]|nr:MAG: large subunit ribosomal protein L25 [Parcubacteria group bacterium LiPW_39]
MTPAVLYGHGIKSVNLSLNSQEFNRAFKEAGETSLLGLVIDGKKHNVLIHDLARDPLSGAILHVDFFEVKMDEKIKTKVPLVFIGDSPAVKTEGGVLIKALQEVELEALPQDLPKEIEVDISGLKAFEDKVRVKDLKVSGSAKILLDPEDMVAAVVPPRSDKELEELGQKPVEEVGEVKVVGEEEKVAAAPVAPATEERPVKEKPPAKES